MITIGYTPSTGNALPGTVSAAGVRPVARVRAGGAPTPSRQVDVCENAKVAAARNSPAAAGLQAQCDAARAAGASTMRTVGGCGAEPATYKNAMGMTRYRDVDAGKRYTDCIGAEQVAKEKAYFDSVVAKKAGGSDGCGPDASTIYDSGSPYTGKALREAWAKCRGVAPGVPSTAAPSTTAPASTSPPIIPGSPQVVPSGLVSPPSGGGGGGSTSVATFDDFQRLAPGGAAFPASNPGGALPPSLQRDTFGAGAHVEAPAWAWIAGGVVALGLGALFLHSKKVI